MRTIRQPLPRLGPLCAAVLCLASCGGQSGPTQYESRLIERDASKSLRTELRMGGGTLKVSGGSPNWMQGEFAYSVPSWKPNIRYATAGGRGDLLVEQPKSSQTYLGNTTNEWDLRLNNEIPTDLIARVGG